MGDRVFVDTNVLVYGHDRSAGRKHEVAVSILRELWESHDGVLSTQILEEFYVTVTRNVAKPLPKRIAREIVDSYAVWDVRPIGVADVVRASELEESARLSFWDALVIVAASRAGAARLLSEDLSAGRKIDGVRIENPFAQVAS